MKTARIIPEDTLTGQALASDPKNSVWVSANAGSGKTHVLAQRVIRLLPALTFTTADARTLVSMLAPMIRDFLANG